MRAAPLLLLLASCVSSELVICDDGRACPTHTVCDLVHQTCVDPEQLAACGAAADFATCATTKVPTGRCFDGVCFPAGCGNGFVEPEELCDDGNTVSGDGCSSECTSAERCGDGFVDRNRGEQCDDANAINRDGCTSRCTSEAVVGTTFGINPTGRENGSAAYDVARRRLVMFGGSSTTVFDDEGWEWAGDGWFRSPGPHPSGRSLHGMAYDLARARTVMFGGLSASGVLNDTWESTPAGWTRAFPLVSPTARLNPSLAYDGHRTILFGGDQVPQKTNDTWAWDGSTWTKLVTQHAPAPRGDATLVFDPKRGRLVLFGGVDDSATPLTDTWSFDGVDWAHVADAGPPRLDWGRAAYDARRGVIVVLGLATGTNASVTWELDGDTWREGSAANLPAQLRGALVAYDLDRERVFTITGSMVSGKLATDRVFEWDGVAWTPRTATTIPPARVACAMASDPVRGRVVMFGGSAADGSLLNDAREWDGSTWRRVGIASSPTARRDAAMAYDAVSRSILMFGGFSTAFLAETWSWDGSIWKSRPTPTGLHARGGAALAYDARRRRVVLFGGRGATGLLADTWEWDGTSWAVQTPATSPPARAGAAMAFDPRSGQVVLFGGADPSAGALADVWTWNGMTWQEVVSSTTPPGRTGHALYFDRARQRLATFGGVATSLSLWELDGASWSQPLTVDAPFSVYQACAAYDDARREAVMFGGQFLTAFIRLTVTLSYRGDVDEVCDAGWDLDGDGKVGCADLDCESACRPLCLSPSSCEPSPSCGDVMCDPTESDRSCPSDCFASATVCGDGACGVSEVCAGECP
ncbi:MAG: DUF4215 domain-containing protein [Myxococcales bacterium]|nr:DUF4215 domain-containing protein [Myxococcales bacterium]